MCRQSQLFVQLLVAVSFLIAGLSGREGQTGLRHRLDPRSDGRGLRAVLSSGRASSSSWSR